jgi:hypothetical protein
MFFAFLLCEYIKIEFMNNQPHMCIRKRALHNMPIVAQRRSRGKALLILNISTTLGWVNSSMPRMLCSQESGPFPTVNKAGWAPGLVQTCMRKRISYPPPGFKSDCPACSKSLHHLPYPPCQPYRGCWYVYGTEKLSKIIVHKDLYGTNSTFAFQYLLIHEFISFLNYTRHFKRKICTVESYIYIYIYIYIGHFTQFL